MDSYFLEYDIKNNFPNVKIIQPDGYIESLKNVEFNKRYAKA